MVTRLLVLSAWSAAALQESTVPRRSCGLALTGIAAAALSPAWAAQSWAEGVFSDPNHPFGERRISVEADGAATVVGIDGVGEAPWRLRARVADDELVLFLKDGAVQPPGGVTIEAIGEDGPLDRTFRGRFDPANDAIAWPDGNRWTRLKVAERQPGGKS